MALTITDTASDTNTVISYNTVLMGAWLGHRCGWTCAWGAPTSARSLFDLTDLKPPFSGRIGGGTSQHNMREVTRPSPRLKLQAFLPRVGSIFLPGAYTKMAAVPPEPRGGSDAQTPLPSWILAAGLLHSHTIPTLQGPFTGSSEPRQQTGILRAGTPRQLATFSGRCWWGQIWRP